MSINRIIIQEYSENWPRDFEALKQVYTAALAGRITAVHHVGSTSVRGLAAKPILDIDLEIPDQALFPEVKQALEQLGYVHIGDLGIREREAFRKTSEHVPHHADGRTWPAHNLYVCVQGNVAMKNHLAFRDYLRANPGKASAYAQLKKQLAEQFAYDIAAYIEAKTAFITEALREQGFDPAALESITEQNKAKKG